MPDPHTTISPNLENAGAPAEGCASPETHGFVPPTPPTYSERLPHGLDQAILRLLTAYVGRRNAVSRARLVAELSAYRVNERQVRQQIRLLRRAGKLIGSAAGEDGGYYLITTLEEFNHFMASEYLAKIKDMSETARAMTRAANQLWGEAALQIPLF
jgi:DNA-binding IscR family transcriptional regulator